VIQTLRKMATNSWHAGRHLMQVGICGDKSYSVTLAVIVGIAKAGAGFALTLLSKSIKPASNWDSKTMTFGSKSGRRFKISDSWFIALLTVLWFAKAMIFPTSAGF
jgi:hypothetical protein